MISDLAGLRLPDFVAALLLRQNLLQQMLGLELGGHLLLKAGGRLARLCHVRARDSHAAFLKFGHAFGIPHGRHGAGNVSRELGTLQDDRLFLVIELFPLRQREGNDGRIDEMLGQRIILGDLVDLNDAVVVAVCS